jgi:DNA-binding NtrC family response regulator
MERLTRYRWPGNIRELQNVMERACVLATTPVVQVVEGLDRSSTVERASGTIATMADAERAHIKRALEATGGTVHGPKGAARLLGVNPNTLRSRMERLGLLTSARR